MDVTIMLHEYVPGSTMDIDVESAPISIVVVPCENVKMLAAISLELFELLVNSKCAGVQACDTFASILGEMFVGKVIVTDESAIGEPHSSETCMTYTELLTDGSTVIVELFPTTAPFNNHV